MSVIHSVFVLDCNGKPLTPTTPCRARKLLRAGVVRKVWSKFQTFGIQMLALTRDETVDTALGVDHGTKFEGYAIVCGNENNISVKWNLPDKAFIAKKMGDRSKLRRTRRYRKCRRRPARFKNRKRCTGFIAPSQQVLVLSRLKGLRELCRIYPVCVIGLEDSRFNSVKNRWGRNFSSMEIGKSRIIAFLSKHGTVFKYQGWETKEFRERYGYHKSDNKGADTFTSHCSDALALACQVGIGERVEPGLFLVVDDTYRPYRRRLHDTQPAKGAIRQAFASGSVFHLRKGLVVGTEKYMGRLCGSKYGRYRYYDTSGKRRVAKQLEWTSSQFLVTCKGSASLAA
jgi:hypothetical protein